MYLTVFQPRNSEDNNNMNWVKFPMLAKAVKKRNKHNILKMWKKKLTNEYSFFFSARASIFWF